MALFFGSFNPIHIGHLALANHIAEFSLVDEVRFVVSPQNPFKQNMDLLADETRLRLVALAIDGYEKFSVTDIEFSMPKPSYTCDTLQALSEREPETEFILVIGSDNIEAFGKWKNAQWITDNFRLMVYPRPGYSATPPAEWRIMEVADAPVFEVSSTKIREAIRKGIPLPYFLHHKVAAEIGRLGLYGGQPQNTVAQ